MVFFLVGATLSEYVEKYLKPQKREQLGNGIYAYYLQYFCDFG